MSDEQLPSGTGVNGSEAEAAGQPSTEPTPSERPPVFVPLPNDRTPKDYGTAKAYAVSHGFINSLFKGSHIQQEAVSSWCKLTQKWLQTQHGAFLANNSVYAPSAQTLTFNSDGGDVNPANNLVCSSYSVCTFHCNRLGRKRETSASDRRRKCTSRRHRCCQLAARSRARRRGSWRQCAARIFAAAAAWFAAGRSASVHIPNKHASCTTLLNSAILKPHNGRTNRFFYPFSA